MGGAADHQRSSSPLKRRASSMDQQDITDTREEDVDMITIPGESLPEASSGKGDASASAKRPTGAVGATNDGALDLPPTTDDQGLPIRTGNQSHLAESAIAQPNPAQAHEITDVPAIGEQINIIETLLKAFAEKQSNEGDVVYLVSRQWLNKAMALGTYNTKNSSQATDDADLGPVDNSDIIQTTITDVNGSQFVKLKPGTGLENFELFPQDAWDLLLAWHGLADGQHPITRTAHNTTLETHLLPNIQFEFHPPVFTIHRIWSANSPIPIEQELKSQNPPPPVVVRSSSYKYHEFLKQAKELVRVPLDRKVRLWKVLQSLPTEDTATQPGGLSTPPVSPGPDVVPGSWPHLLVEVTEFLKLQKDVERDLVDVPDTTHHAKYNGSRSLATVNLTVDTVLVIDESINSDFVSTYNPARSTSKDKGPARSNSVAVSIKSTGSGRNSPAPGPTTRGRAGQQQRSGRTLGCVGLQNLGNTCYMNSALQCVRSVEELTKYFLTHESDKEINSDNPLSHNGDVARAYGRLLDEIYRDPPPHSVAPRNFKNTIGRYAPSFSGYGQQDTQEFLGFLLDGLQEDLNRIKKKPYIEKPDSTDDMIDNPDAIRAMADQVWDITKKRDDSVIADLFTGMYQSTLVCPVCAKVSITFDPFTNLTLPLPIANIWTTSRLLFFPLNDEPVQLEVDLDKNSSIKSLKHFVSERVGVPVDRLFAGEGFRNKFFKLYEDLSTVYEEIATQDIPVIHELEAVPTNTPWSKRPMKQKYRSLLDDNEETPVPVWEEPASERILVPVIHRVHSEHRHRKLPEKDHIPAHCIVLTVEEARSEDIIRRKILEKMATFSTWKGFQDAEMEEENTDPEMVNTSSDGDSNVIAKSVEGEDGLVDVKMADDSETHKTGPSSSDYPKLLKKFNTRRPKWIDPRQFLDAEMQNLFELSYFEGTTNIPYGWTEVTDDNQLPRLSSRQPKPASDMEMNSPSNGWDGSEDSGNGESLRSQPTAATRMVDESSEEDSDISPVIKNIAPSRQLNSRAANQGVQRGKKPRAHKTYSRKGRRGLAKQARKEPQNSYYPRSEGSNDQEDNTFVDGGPLVRLGEGIVVDWQEDVYITIFGGEERNEERGMATWKNVVKLEDPGLETHRKQRDLQRKQGISLDDCLAEFEKEEILSEQDTWYCPRCKEHRRASKKFDLWKTPDILAVHLKRFSSTGHRREKLDILVDFPIEGLDLTERVIDNGDGKKEIYDLIAIDDHWGGLGGGHYTAFARNFIDGEWYEYNDTSVSKQKDLSRLVTKSAYLLFYRRRSETALGGPRFQQIMDQYDNQPTDESDSGEGQRLGQGSSQRGSSSALTGAGLTLHNENRGSDSAQSGGRGFGNDTEMNDYSPLYRGGNMDDILEDTDADGNQISGMNQWQADQPRRSIEQEDEAIDMGDFGFNDQSTSGATNMDAQWSFRNIESGGGLARSEAGDSDIDSLAAQGDDASSIADDMEDEEARYAVLGGLYPRHVSDYDGGAMAGPNSCLPPPEPTRDLSNYEVGAMGFPDQALGPEPGADYILPDQLIPPPPYEVTADEIVDNAAASKEERVTEIHIEDKEDDEMPERGRGRSQVAAAADGEPKAN